jgi:hypothetical protein
MFDTEQYNAQVFHYAKQKHQTTKTFDEYRAKVRQRGAEWMKAVNGPFPGITIMMTYAYSIIGGQPKGRQPNFYGLLGDFLDGMLDAATPQTKLVDAWEGAYTYAKERQFQWAYDRIKAELPKLAADPEKYRRHFQAGFGIWMDCNSNSIGWHVDDLSKNSFTPAKFENSVRLALHRTDQYVWIYTERLRWWTNEKLPPAYVEALSKAREARNPSP